MGYNRIAYTQRPFTHPLAKELASLMEEKSSNICLAADVKSMDQLLRIAELVGDKIVILKTHVDTYKDFSQEKLKTLQEIAKRHKFVIFEDRKFMDIGNTVKMQYTGGTFEIAKWSRLTNAAIPSGPDILKALKEGIEETAKTVAEATNNAILLLAEMSSKGNTFIRFLDETKKAASDYSDIVIGFISQRNFGDPKFLYMTPGVNATQKSDQLGQEFKTPEDVIKTGSDILIIGRGIYEDSDPAAAAQRYKEAGWKAHQLALGTFIFGQ